MFKKIDELNIHYNTSGEGDFLFMLQGWGTGFELYDPVAKLLAQKFKVVQFDFPGFGKSDEPKEIWDVSRYAEFTRDFIKSFGAKEIILWAHSFGGRVILKMNALPDLPFKITKIIFNDSAGVLPQRSKKQKRRTKMYKAGKAVLSIPIVKKIYPDALENLRKKYSSADYLNASPVMRGVLVKSVNEDLTPYLKLIKCSTLLVWGKDDTATPIRDAHIFEKEISAAGTDVGLCELNGGHFAFAENPVIYANILKSYLKIGEGN